MIALACDHGGYVLKADIIKYFEENGIPYRYFGSGGEAVDYPDVALPAAGAIASGECEKGIFCCGTGVGISMAANKVPGIRAACCSDCYSAKLTRMHNDANVLCMGGRVVGPGVAVMMTDIFLHTEFEGGRHRRRVDKITKIEQDRPGGGASC